MKLIIFNLYIGKQIDLKVITGLLIQKIIAKESKGIKTQTMTQRYAKALALLSSDIGEKTSSILFKKAK